MTSLLLIGCGKMGGALLARWVKTRPAGIDHFIVVDPQAKNAFPEGAVFHISLDDVPKDAKPDIVVLAIKPQQMDEALPKIAARFKTSPLYISIAAGKSLAYLERFFSGAQIVRAMPNTPALIGEGMTTLIGNASLSDTYKTMAAELMDAAGKSAWLENETQMDAATAISGSGPAYVFLYMETLVRAATVAGLDEKLSTDLVRQTIKGAALLAQEGDFTMLRQQVTSPGGTTEAALTELMKEDALESLVKKAIQAAQKRASEL